MARSVIGIPAGTLNYGLSDLFYSPYSNNGNPSVSYAAFPISENATASNLYVQVSANAFSSSIDVTLNVNGVDSSLSISIPASTSGLFSDVSNTVALSAGDLICWKVTGASSGYINASLCMSLDI